MGSKSRSTITGYQYQLGMHVVVCQSPIDGISEIQFGDRSAWQGMVQDGQISINRPDLFGGQAREGGVAGFIDVEGGAASQTANNYLSTYLRPGQLMPAFRGVFGLVFRRFYWGNNPYIKPLRLKVSNVFNTYGQWLPGLAPIGGEFSLSNTAVHLALDCSTSMVGTPFTNQIAAAKAFVSSMSGYPGVSCRVQPFGTNSFGSIERTNIDAADVTAINAFIDTLSATATDTNYDVGITGAGSFFSAAEAAIGADVSSSNYVSAASGDSGSVGTTGAYSAMRRVIVFMSDGGATGTTDEDAAADIAAISGSVEVFGIGLGASGDLATIDNTPQDGVPVINSTEDEITGILSGAFNLHVDINPAHILRDVLISPTSDGSGETGEIGSTFATAAQTLFDEGFGLSFFWQNPSDKEAFKANVERHIGAAVYRDSAGLWQIKLIRPDYTVGDLFTYDSGKIVEWLEFERPQQFELPNSITVVYTRRDNGDDASVTLHNVAAIQTTGRVINEKLSFEGITRPELANKVAQRELVSKTQPLAAGAVRVAYLPTSLNLGSAFIIDEPRMGIDSMVCRITEIEEGAATDSSVIIRFVEDVFATDPADASFGAGDEGTQDVATPVANSVVFFEEASYFDQVISRGQTQTDDELTVDPGLGNWQVTGDRPNAQHIDAEVVRYDYPNWINVGPGPMMPTWVLSSALSRAADATTFSAAATGREFELEAGQRIQIGSEVMRLDSVAVASGVATFTVGRGCLDTVPQAHAAYSYIMAWPGYTISDGIDYTDGEDVKVRLLPRTVSSSLALGLASDNDLTMASRAFRPLPVGRLQVGGSYEPSGEQSGLVEVTWAHRDRLTQTTTAISDHTATSIGPESGVSYILVRRLIDLVSGVETVSHTVEEAISPPQETSVYVDLDDTAFSVYAGANTIAMEIGIKTVRESSPEYENWQTPFVRFETSFANDSSAASSVISSPLAPPSGAVHWYDFSDSANYTLSGSEITAATDLGSGGAALGSAAGKYPVISTINSIGAADFDGTNDILKNVSGLDSSLEANTAAITMAVVYQYDTTPAAAGLTAGLFFMARADLTGKYTGLRGASADDVSFFIRGVTTGVAVAAPSVAQDTNPHVLIAVLRSDDTADLYYDGSLVAYNVDTSGAGNRQLNGHISIGAISSFVSTESNFTDGKIGEAIVYASALGGSDITDLNDYLTTKWGI